MPDERIILEFRALAADVPAPVRVRALLKRALRSYRLECVRVLGLPDSWDEPAVTPTLTADERSAAKAARESPEDENALEMQ